MCRTVHAVLQTLICGVQMLVRVLMTVLLMIENLIRMILQTLYNFISFMLQLLSLIPICVVFLVSARLKCFMCGGGGGCQPGRGGACDCIMSLLAIVILFFIFKSTGVMDKIFYSMGYAKAAYEAEPYVPTPGDITECSRNDTEQDIEYLVRTETYIAAAETTAAEYLDTLVEDYIQKIITKSEYIAVPPEAESTHVPIATKIVDMGTTFTSQMVTSLTAAATDAATTTSTAEAFEMVNTKAFESVAPEATKIVTDVVTTSFTTETLETDTTTAVDTEAPEATEIVATTSENIITSVTTTAVEVGEVTTLDSESVEAVTFNATEAVDSLTPAIDEPDMLMSDTPFNAVTEALDMEIYDTPFNGEETTETIREL